MTRIQWLLVGVIAAELAIGGYFVVQRLGQLAPPIPDLSAVDRAAAAEIRALAANCRTLGQWAVLGEVYLATGFFPEAEACLREASARDPARADLAFKHGFALERLGKLEEANAQYESAVKLNHSRAADCWYYIGKNHLRLEREGPAAAAFKQAGNLAGARYELALLNARSGQVDEANAEANHLAAEFPVAYHPVALKYRLALAKEDQTAAAIQADLFGRKPRPLPTPFDTEVDWVFGIANGVGQNRLFREGGQEMSAGQLDRAEKKLRSALAARWDPAIADKLADILFAQGKRHEAAGVLQEAIERGRPSFELLWRLGQAHEAMGQPAKTLNLWQRAAQVATGPGARDLWEDLADHYQRAGDNEWAKTFSGRAALAAGIELLDAGKLEGALRHLKIAVEEDSQLVSAWYFLGEAYRANEEPMQAKEAYQHCLEINPDHGRARQGLKLLGEDFSAKKQ